MEEKQLMKKKLKEEKKETKINFQKDKELQDTLIGSYTSLTGDIVSEKSLRIDGKLTGNIECAQRVIIGEKALIKGNIKAEKVTLYGCVEGDIEVKEILEIMASGKLMGDAKVKYMTLEEGGIFCGTSQMECPSV